MTATHITAPDGSLWRTIESAPKDGTLILIAGGTKSSGWSQDMPFSGVSIAYWYRGYEPHWRGDDLQAHDEWYSHQPTHWMPLPAPPGAAAPEFGGVAVAWRCFHCDEVFTDREAAAQHFGTHEYQQPACLIDVAEYRRMEGLQLRYADEDADVHRAMRRMETEHQQALRRAEEAGYAKGLADSGKCPCARPPAADEAMGRDAALLGEYRALYRAYVRLLEAGRDRIIAHGGDCDPVDRMERDDIDLIRARQVISEFAAMCGTAEKAGEGAE